MNPYSIAESIAKGEEIALVHVGDDHSKFWKIKLSAPRTVVVHNGRLGTKGVPQKPKVYDSDYGLTAGVTAKVTEKRRKGYKHVTLSELKRLNVRAAAVGSTNKCHAIEWVERYRRDNSYVPVSDDKLANPEYCPIMLVEVSTKGVDHVLLFTAADGNHELVGGRRSPIVATGDTVFLPGGPKPFAWVGSELRPIAADHPLHKVALKVEESIGGLCGC